MQFSLVLEMPYLTRRESSERLSRKPRKKKSKLLRTKVVETLKLKLGPVEVSRATEKVPEEQLPAGIAAAEKER